MEEALQEHIQSPETTLVAESWPENRRARVLALAAAWGCSPAYIYQQEKKGCPLHSQATADSWRREHSRLGIGYRSKGAHRARKNSSGECEGKLPKVENFETRSDENVGRSRRRRKIKLDSLEASLQQAIEMEEEAATAVHECLDDPEKRDSLLTAMNAFNKAQANRMEREKGVLELLEAQKKLIPMDAALELIQKAWGPLLARLRSAPKRAAIKANPMDDALAEAVFSEEIEEAIAEASKTYEDILAA